MAVCEEEEVNHDHTETPDKTTNATATEQSRLKAVVTGSGAAEKEGKESVGPIVPQFVDTAAWSPKKQNTTVEVSPGISSLFLPLICALCGIVRLNE